MSWLSIIGYGIAIVIVAPFVLILVVMLYDMCCTDYNKYAVEDIKVGNIIDFEISAGGFGHSDECKVVTDTEKVVGLSGTHCYNLESGNELWHKTESDGLTLRGSSYYYIKKIGVN